MTTIYTRDELTAMNRTQLLELHPTATKGSTKTKLIELILQAQNAENPIETIGTDHDDDYDQNPAEDDRILQNAGDQALLQQYPDADVILVAGDHIATASDESVDLSDLSEAGAENKGNKSADEGEVTIEYLLIKLQTTTDKNTKKKIRAQLRTRGYRLSDVKAQSKVQKAAAGEENPADDANNDEYEVPQEDVDLSLNMPEE